MVQKRSWKEFRDTGLLFYINQVLHAFGWAIVLVVDDNVVLQSYPARIKFRGFSEDCVEDGYNKIDKYIREDY